jgi:hypothetical protein
VTRRSFPLVSTYSFNPSGDPTTNDGSPRSRRGTGRPHWQTHLLEAWNHPLQLEQTFPTLPLWLAEDFAVPLELEANYEQTLWGDVGGGKGAFLSQGRRCVGVAKTVRGFSPEFSRFLKSFLVCCLI